MTTVNGRFLREEVDAAKARAEALRASGKLSPEVDALFGLLFSLLDLLIVAFLEKTTRKDSANSGIPPSQTEKDETSVPRSRTARETVDAASEEAGAEFETVTVEETATVEACEACGADLGDVDAIERERRTRLDIAFQVIERHVDAEVKRCPDCRTRTKAPFPDDMPGPLQYGQGFQALVVSLLVAHMVSLNRTVSLVQAICGRKLSEATCLGYVERLYRALEEWERAAVEALLTRPALCVDETGMRVDKKRHWIHVVTDGALTLKLLHRKRGTAATNEIGILPRYAGVLIHDGFGAYFTYDNCTHALCGAHLLRDLYRAVQTNGFRWARLMTKLLQETCHRVKASKAKALTEEECRAIRKRYRTILTQGARELPEIPPRKSGQRGRIAKTDAHNLHERLTEYEDEVLRFMRDPHVSFTNNRSENNLRMAKVKQKVSGCFRTFKFGAYYCRISSYFKSAAAQGYGPIAATKIALNGRATELIPKPTDNPNH